MSDADPNTILIAQLEVEHCSAELYLNDIPLSHLREEQNMAIENRAAEEFIVPGANRLEVWAEPGPHPSAARTAGPERAFTPMRATARLIRFRDGSSGYVEHGELLAEATFVWADGEPEKRRLPATAVTSFDMGAAHGRWAWQDAPVLTLDDALIVEARACMDQLEQVTRRGDVAAERLLVGAKYDDAKRAYGAIDEAVVVKDVTARLKDIYGAPEPVLPRDPDKQDFRLVADGRMVELLNLDYDHSFTVGTPDGEPLSYPLLLARIGGSLKIVR